MEDNKIVISGKEIDLSTLSDDEKVKLYEKLQARELKLYEKIYATQLEIDRLSKK